MATIKGSWLLNATLSHSGLAYDTYYNLNFTLGDYTINRIGSIVYNGTRRLFFRGVNSDGAGVSGPLYNFETNQWSSEEYRQWNVLSDTDDETIKNWIIANATKQAAEEEETFTKTAITYNGSTIATLEAGQTATIKTASTEVDYDIVVKAGSGEKVEEWDGKVVIE